MAGEFYIREPLLPGMCGEDVRLFQEGLRASGFASVPENGVFGPETSAAWKEIFIATRLEDFDHGRDYKPTQREQEFLREQFPNDEDFARGMRAYAPETFSSRDAYESFLRSEPSPIPPGVSSFSWNDVHSYGFSREIELGREAGAGMVPSQTWNDWTDDLRKLKPGDSFRNTDIPPPGSDQCLIADAGKSLAPQEVTDHPLYASLRAKVPTEVSDLQVSELTLRALKDGITGPDRLGDVVVTDKRVFAEGTTPGFRGYIDLANPPMTPGELRSAMNELPVAGAAPAEELAQARSVARA